MADAWTARRLWDRAACLACEQGIGGFLDAELMRQGADVPGSARGILTAFREHLAAANRAKLRALQRVIDALADQHVPFLVLKGAALNAGLYGRLDLRGMSDVDLLIREHDLPAAGKVLSSLAARPQSPPLHRDMFPRFYYEQPWVTADGPPLRIDLHVRPLRPVLYRRTVPREAMWLRPRELEMCGRIVLTPGLEETLIHLCVHAAGHGLRDLRWLYDILYLLRRHGPELDVACLCDWAVQWRLAYPLRRTLQRVRAVFCEVHPAAGWIVGHLPAVLPGRDWLAIHQAPRDAGHPLSHVLVDLVCLSGWRERIDYLAMHLRPADAHLRERYASRHAGWRLAAQGRRLLAALAKG